MQPPRRKDHRQRAHSNPFSDHDLEYPMCPAAHGQKPEMVDVGCGYGGMLFALQERYPEKRVLGMEIRKKLAEYVAQKIKCRGTEKGRQTPAVVRTNAMKFLPNYLEKASVEKMFILFPDPHFKKKKRKARIVSPLMLDIYHYVLREKGALYVSTDVEELFAHMAACIGAHPLFRRLPQEEEERDPLFRAIVEVTEESRKAEMKRSRTYRAIFEKLTPAG